MDGDQLYTLLTVICDCRGKGVADGVIVILLVILLVGLVGRPLASAGVLLSCTALQGLMGLELV